MRDSIRTLVIGISLGALLLPAAQPILAAEPVEVVFDYTGSAQSFVAPSQVTSIHVVLVGAPGGAGRCGGCSASDAAAGSGARVSADLPVSPGDSLIVMVGGVGHSGSILTAPAFNGGARGGGEGGPEASSGGGGGGASDIRTISPAMPGTLGSRLVVAGGGGGGGGGSDSGTGGSAGITGGTAATGGAAGGGAGTSTGGGTGGASTTPFALNGSDGSAGNGGIGGDGTQQGRVGGGGGAGGYFGGGGGAGGAGGPSGAGGGGGGSSYTGVGSNATVANDATGTPSITITYTPDGTPPDPTSGPDTGVVDADVTVPTSAACIELSTTSVSFGTQAFGGVDLQGTPAIQVTNCSNNNATLLAHGTDASAGGAIWTLVDDAKTCEAGTLATDDFHLKLLRSENFEITQLGTDNKTVGPLTAGTSGTLNPLLDMPCPGSSGAGQTMGMQIVFVVTE